ncbi:Receptor-type tyrosine-protein phosphatase mu, partial [Stegodyphus mimosarum]
MSKYFAELIFRTSETVPGPVSDLECQAVDGQPNLLLVSWEAPSEVNGAIKGYIITYTLIDRGQCGVSGDSDDSGMRQMQSDDTEVTLQNLYPYSTYNITVQARTSAGEGEGISATAATSEAAPNEAPQNVRVISVTSRSLEFGWDPVPCESANGIVLHYEYMVVSGYDIYPTILQRVKRSIEDTDSHLLIVEGHQVTIGNLKPHTFYGFMVRGVTAAGSGPLSDIIFHKTDESVSSQPLFLDVISVASERLGVAWRQPESPNGEIIQYRAQVWDHELSHLTADVIFNVTDDENEEGKFAKIIENLKPASDYFIKIQAATRAGWGAFSDPIPARTLDGVPGEPSEIDVLENGQRTINITWQPPILKNGVITGYKIIYRPLSTLDPVFNATPFVSLEKEVGGGVTDISLQDLHPSTEYNITIQAKTSTGYGRPAEIKTWTVILGDHVSPSVRAVEVEATNDTIPILFSTTGSTSVYKYQVIVEDARNSEPIDEDLLSDFDTAVVKQNLPYYIAAELDPQNVSSTGEHSFVVGDRKVWGGYKNVHLNPGHEYKIRIRTLVVKDQELKSVLSEPKEETAASTFVQVLHCNKPKIFGMEPIVFILILIAVLVLITAITFLTILAIYSKRQRKKSTNSFSTRDSGLSGSMTWSVMYKVPDNEVIESPLVTSGFRTLPLIEKNASLKRSKSDSKIVRGMRIETLEEFLINVRGTNQLVEEFKRLVEGQTSPWTAARKNCNLKKNRYGNILPYDRSRVVLHTDSNKSDSDYINASYIDGYRRPREYIVTQGPLENTITDFWRMIWQENAPVIVMVTDLVENGKKKCAKYWPDDSIMCDDMQILVIHSEESTDFVIRTILMRKMDEIRTHRVMQYQFTGWPDRSVPTNTNYFIKFLKKVRDDHPVMGGPMVVMCSAGAGRSGTYVAIDALCQQAAEDKRVDVFRFVNNARHQRVHFVQTLEQYTFIYEALVEAIQYEDTSVPLEKIGMYLKELNHMSTLDKRALILKQYNKLNRAQKKVDANRCSVALSEVNIFKNRDPLTVPEDEARVKVYVDDRNEDHMGYINAVFVDGYRKKGAYIVTQMPMTHTTEDFWRMIYQYRSSFIVMLNGSDETDDLNVGIYWPELGGCSYGEFEVDVVTYEEHEDFIMRIMRLTNSLQMNEEPHEVIQFQYKAWSSEMKPASMLKLLHNTDLWYHKSAGGPITVHCMDGATRSGLFIAACFIRDQINSEEVLDTFQVVKSIRLNRPEFIPNSDQYRFLFEVAQELADPIIHRYEELSQPAKKLSFKI